MKVWLDDWREAPAGFVWVRTAESAITLMNAIKIEEIWLDSDLGYGFTEGYKVADWIEDQYHTAPQLAPRIEILTDNPVARRRMEEIKRRLGQEE